MKEEALANCEYCGVKIKDKGFKKTLMGKQHVFCMGGCYILYRYDVPKERVIIEGLRWRQSK